MRNEIGIIIICGIIASLVFLATVHANEPVESATVWLDRQMENIACPMLHSQILQVIMR